tara:strand:- start:615 stop:1214 length:600 start_codon:yes stop_codon:yes gene_type:complete
MDETLEWKQHPRHTRYLLSEKGDIWDCDRLKAKKTSYDHKNHVRCVCLYQSNREQLNRLVFETFYPDEPLGSAEIIKFEDGDHMNCNYKNLSTTTRSKSCRQWKKGKGYIVHTDKRFSKKLNKQVQYTKYRATFKDQTTGKLIALGSSNTECGARRLYVKYAYEQDSDTYSFLESEYKKYFKNLFLESKKQNEQTTIPN